MGSSTSCSRTPTTYMIYDICLRLQQPLEAVAQHAGLAEHLVRGRGRGRVRVRGRVRASPST